MGTHAGPIGFYPELLFFTARMPLFRRTDQECGQHLDSPVTALTQDLDSRNNCRDDLSSHQYCHHCHLHDHLKLMIPLFGEFFTVASRISHRNNTCTGVAMSAFPPSPVRSAQSRVQHICVCHYSGSCMLISASCYGGPSLHAVKYLCEFQIVKVEFSFK